MRAAATLSCVTVLAIACARSAAPPAERPAPEPIPGLEPARPLPPALEVEPSRLPPVPAVDGPLAIRVVYPPARAVVSVRDSSFLFGSVGSGRASLAINGQPVRVWPNGTWLAWVRFPEGPAMRFELEARRGEELIRATHEVQRAPRFTPRGRLWVDTTSFTPRGLVWWPPDEPLPIAVRATEGASVRLLLPGGGVVPLSAVPDWGPVDEGLRAFDRDTANLARPPRRDRYAGALRGMRLGPDLGSPFGSPRDPATPEATLEAVLGGDTVRVRWPLRVTLLSDPPTAALLDDDRERTGRTDGITVGRALPGGTYHWFFPNGTRAAVAGRVNGDLRLRLSERNEAWVAAAEAVGLGPGAAAGRAVVGSLTATARPGRVQVRIPVSSVIPYRVDEDEGGLTLTLHGAAADPNWIRYGETPGLLRPVTWRQASRDEAEFRLALARPLWGYRVRWERSDLLIDLRAAPALDESRPLRGRLIVVDPGHPPGGATGPGGLTEAEANYGIAEELQALLARAGAVVVLTRGPGESLELWPRVRLADTLDADLLVSIHNNALPDGVNPFGNSGSSVFYFHPRSLSLARAVQAALVRRTGLRDLGVARGDLALVRGTWMPSILTEGMFMMLPEHEAALASPAGRRAYAEAVFEGIQAFLREVARGPAGREGGL